MSSIKHVITNKKVDIDNIEIDEGGTFVSFDMYDDSGFQVQISSVDEEVEEENEEYPWAKGRHEVFAKFVGRKIKVTIETID